MKFIPHSPRPRKSPRLSLCNLEDRATPATAVYSAVTQTLTVTAATGDRLIVDAVTASNKPTGYITVIESQASVTVFNSDNTNQGVRNLVVKFGNGNTGDFVLGSTTVLGGNLTIAGAKATQTVALFGTVGGNVVYTAAPGPMPGTLGTASDEINLEPTTVIGGNLTLGLGSGTNTVRLKGGTVRGGLTIAGGAGADRVEITASADLVVGASAAFNLGDGNNTVLGIATRQMRVGGAFTYTGGVGNDTFDLDASGAGLSVGTDARFTLGTPLGFDSNTAAFEFLSAGRNITFIGGAGADNIETSGILSAGVNLTAVLGNGANVLDSNLLGSGTNVIGGSFTYTGGMGADTVTVDNTTIGRNVSVALGEAVGGSNSFFGTGTKGPGPVTVYGNLKVTDGSGASGIFLQRLYVGGGLTVLGGAGADNVIVDDAQVAGPALFDMGAGIDSVHIEQTLSNGGGPLTGATTFGGTFTFRGGDGNDGVFLTEDNSASLKIDFGGKVVLVGGAGTDQLVLKNGASFELTGNTDDFEVHNANLP